MFRAIWQFIHKMGSPKYFYDLSGKWVHWLGWPCLILMIVGYIGAFLAPPDYQQGETIRILYVHVPTAILSQSIYMFMAVNAAIALIWRIKVSNILARSSAPIGACFTLIALATGALWGKPMWGTYWVWDARLTSELILLFIYLGLIALYAAFDDKDVANTLTNILSIVGIVIIPIIKFSVEWWSTLHQPATISKLGKPSMATEMLIPLLILILAYYLYFFTSLLMRARVHVIEREKQSRWVQTMMEGK